MNTLLFVTEKLKIHSRKLDKFAHTYMRCFDHKDREKLIRKNHIGKLLGSLILSPLPVFASYSFPYDLVYSEFFDLPFIYELPGYVLVAFVSRELLGNLFFRSQLRYKQALYDKYLLEMDLTKDQVEELDYEEEKLRLEGSKPEEKSK